MMMKQKTGFIPAAAPVCTAPPIRLHPTNPRWFQWRGRFLAPWARSDQPGYAGGGNTFDLSRFSADYLARLKDFVGEAGRRGVVVELTLFCATYNEKQWLLHPLNPANNVQALPVPDWRKLNTLPADTSLGAAGAVSPAFAVQQALTRWLVREWNRGLGRVIGCDETGFAGRGDDHYRRQAWRFILGGGGALFNNLDYSFTVGREDGSDTANQAPGGGSPALRRQLEVLSDFLQRFDLARLHPDPQLVARAPGVRTHALSDPGKAHAIYVQGRGPTTLMLNLAGGRWTAEWISFDDGHVRQRDTIVAEAGGECVLASPRFTDAVALGLRLQ
jgi:hypothetical protein